MANDLTNYNIAIKFIHVPTQTKISDPFIDNSEFIKHKSINII